jgi:hypothetical protein
MHQYIIYMHTYMYTCIHACTHACIHHTRIQRTNMGICTTQNNLFLKVYVHCTEIEKERLIRIDGFAEFARRNMLVSIVRTNTSFHGSQKSPIDACFGQGGYGYG